MPALGGGSLYDPARMIDPAKRLVPSTAAAGHPIHDDAEAGDHRVECATILLEFGAELSPKIHAGETPLTWAEKHGLKDITEFLKSRDGV